MPASRNSHQFPFRESFFHCMPNSSGSPSLTLYLSKPAPRCQLLLVWTNAAASRLHSCRYDCIRPLSVDEQDGVRGAILGGVVLPAPLDRCSSLPDPPVYQCCESEKLSVVGVGFHTLR